MKADIIRLLLYFEIFQHPLSLYDIQLKFRDSEKIEDELNELTEAGLVHFSDGYYFMFDGKDKIQRRIKGNEKATSLMPKAIRKSTFISRFPFVEGVALSGSLSKGVLYEDGDFDFFIITKPNRLWIARSVLILYKKLFLLNSKRFFCVNYFIDSENLEIEEKNIFTAMEVSTLLPMEGAVFQKFRESNKWVNEYVYYPEPKKNNFSIIKKSLFAKLTMYACSGRFGDWLDTYFLRLTLKNWNKKFDHFEKVKFDLTMKSRKYISKHHPNNFQHKVLTRYSENLIKYRDLNLEKLNELEIIL